MKNGQKWISKVIRCGYSSKQSQIRADELFNGNIELSNIYPTSTPKYAINGL